MGDNITLYLLFSHVLLPMQVLSTTIINKSVRPREIGGQKENSNFLRGTFKRSKKQSFKGRDRNKGKDRYIAFK